MTLKLWRPAPEAAAAPLPLLRRLAAVVGTAMLRYGTGSPAHGAARSLVKLSSEAPELSSASRVLKRLQLVPTNPAERKTMEDIQGLLRNPDVKTSDVDKVLHSYLGLCL